VPWLAVLERGVSPRAALAAGLGMSVAFVLAVFGWFAPAIATYTGVPLALALVVLVVLAPLLEPQLVTFALARHLARRASLGFWGTAVVGASVYVGTEWAVPKLFGDTIGHGLHASAWMRQAADLAGAHGLTFVLVLANECAWVVVARRAELRRALAPAACAAALAAGLCVYGAVRSAGLEAGSRRGGTVSAGVVQADIAQYERMRAQLGSFEAVRAILDAHFALSSELMTRIRIDLLVWPETVYPTTFGTPKSDEGAAFDRAIGAFVAAARVPLVFGAYDAEEGDEFNAAVFLEPAENGRLAFETYRKASLFPLTERVPWPIGSQRVRRWLPWLGTWKPGVGPQVVPLALPDGRTVRIAPLICYDAVDPGVALAAVRQGAELIVTLSNDSWFATGLGPRLHLVVSAFRSIETRRPQVRATNTGISAVISPAGEILSTAEVHERKTLVATVRPEREASTLMLAWGDWFGPSALVCGVALLSVGLAVGSPRPDRAPTRGPAGGAAAGDGGRPPPGPSGTRGARAVPARARPAAAPRRPG
jgi:apolipoprotein N-acyltransferase